MDRFSERDSRRDSAFAEAPRRRNRSRSAERDEDERALRRGGPPTLPADGRRDDRGPPPRRAPASPPPRGGAPVVDDRFVDADDDSEDERPREAAVPVPPPAPLPPPEHRKLELPAGVDDDEAMMRLLGFSGFESTKGTHVADNDSTAARGAVRKVPKREYRQYMHRKGGFNRPLSPSKPIGNPDVKNK